MSILEPYADESQSATERLLESSWEARERQRLAARAGRRGLGRGGCSSLPPPSRSSPAGWPACVRRWRCCSMAVYAVVGRIEFPVGAGLRGADAADPRAHAADAARRRSCRPRWRSGWSAATPWNARWDASPRAGSCRRSRTPGTPSAPPRSCSLAGSPRIGFDQLPLLAAAFAAGCIVDLAGSMARMRLAGVVPDLKLQMRVIALVWAVDASLAPLGFLAAHGRAPRLRARSCSCCRWCFCCGCWPATAASASTRPTTGSSSSSRSGRACSPRSAGSATRSPPSWSSTGCWRSSCTARWRRWTPPPGAWSSRGPAPLELTAGDAAALDIGRGLRWPAIGPRGRSGRRGGRVDAQRADADHRLAARGDRRAALRARRPRVRGRRDRTDRGAGRARPSCRPPRSSPTRRSASRRSPIRSPGWATAASSSADLGAALRNSSPARPSLLLLFDLDGFKDYNDTFGHLAGDALLARLGGKLQKAVAGLGAAYRLGGDEFCAHLDLDGQDSDALIHRAAAALTETGVEFSVQASLGVVAPAPRGRQRRPRPTGRRRAHVRQQAQPFTPRAARPARCSLRTMHAKQPDLDEHSSTSPSSPPASRAASASAARISTRSPAPRSCMTSASSASPTRSSTSPAGLSRRRVGVHLPAHDPGRAHPPWRPRAPPGGPARPRQPRALGRHRLPGSPPRRGDPARRPHRQRLRRLRGDDRRPLLPRRGAPRRSPARSCCRSSGTQFDPAVVEAFLAEIETAGDERELDAAQHAAAHVRTLLASA